jgi:hypothetical protein
MDKSHKQAVYNIIGTHLINRHSEGVNITRLLQSASHEPFRRHPVASAYDPRSIRACCSTRGIGFHAGETEIAQYGRCAVINQHIKLKYGDCSKQCIYSSTSQSN